MAYGTFETLRQQKSRTAGNGGAELRHSAGGRGTTNLDTVTVRSDHHTLSLYVADGYESYQKTPQGWKNGGGPDRFCLMPKGAESTWDIRGGPLFCPPLLHPMRICDASGNRSGTAARPRLACRNRPFPGMIKSPRSIVSFSSTTTGKQQANQLTLSSASTLLLTHLIQHYSNVQWRLPTVTGGLARTFCARFWRGLKRTLTSPLTLADLAQETALSEYHFARMFRQSMKMAPHQYVMQRRMLRAQELICHSARSLTDIAPGLRLQLRQPFQQPRQRRHRPDAVAATRGAALIAERSSPRPVAAPRRRNQCPPASPRWR
nr:transcriptional regulator [Raoultella sp. NCTC 9187]